MFKNRYCHFHCLVKLAFQSVSAVKEGCALLAKAFACCWAVVFGTSSRLESRKMTMPNNRLTCLTYHHHHRMHLHQARSTSWFGSQNDPIYLTGFTKNCFHLYQHARLIPRSCGTTSASIMPCTSFLCCQKSSTYE